MWVMVIKSPSGDRPILSPHDVTACSDLQVMRITEMITRDEIAWQLIQFYQLEP